MTLDCLRIDTPIGPLGLAADRHGLHRIQFQASPDLAWAGPGARLARSTLLDQARTQLEAYFAGTLRRFDLPLVPRGTDFQRRVWLALAAIPWGETRNYGELATAIGRPGAARAVGGANGRNPLPIVLPCHRVIGADGSLTGFGGGLPIKRRLLVLEGWHGD
ncbi:MAG: methylated-DNA--[protein]-cysteine S-methyltransferase [Xanthomonadales bacterium]|nr:methylated-DNA--[protein]-cysteine S-methyltransferase [Xanthomonadales bacterium]